MEESVVSKVATLAHCFQVDAPDVHWFVIQVCDGKYYFTTSENRFGPVNFDATVRTALEKVFAIMEATFAITLAAATRARPYFPADVFPVLGIFPAIKWHRLLPTAFSSRRTQRAR